MKPNKVHEYPMTRRTFLTGTVAAAAAVSAADAQPGKGEKPSRRPICVFSKHLQWLDYGAMAETAAEIGFDGVDIPVRPGGHVLPERVEDDLPSAVEAVRKAGLTVPLMTTAITGPDTPHAGKILATAADLGVGYYRLGYLSYDESLGIAGSLDAYRPQLRELAAMNRQYSIHGDYQNHAGTNVGAPVWDLWYLIRDLDPQWIGCQYDIRHATVEGGTSWSLGLGLIAGFVKTTVVKDFKWGLADGSWHVIDTPVGEGMVDFKAYYKLIKKLNISGPISMHFEYPHEQKRETVIPLMRKDLAALRSYLKEAGLM